MQAPIAKRENGPDPHLMYIELYRLTPDKYLTSKHARFQNAVYTLEKNYTNPCLVSMDMSRRYFKNRNNSFFIR